MQPESTPHISTDSSQSIPFWLDPAKRAIIYQLVTLLVTGAVGGYLVFNTVTNLHRQSIATGFHFLGKEASFEIGESLIAYSATSSYARALLVGILNTLEIAFIGIIFTVLLGTLMGIARLSTNWLVSRLAAVYIEIFQNTPILLQLFFWYAVFCDALPPPRLALKLAPGMFLSNRGLTFGIPAPHPAHLKMLVAFFITCAGVYALRKWARKRQDETGKAFPLISSSAAILLGFPLMVWGICGAPTAMNMPQLSGFNFSGGLIVSPEFTALLLGLVLYTAAFVAEIVRSGIQSVSRGQTEAAMSLGLRPSQILTLVILPQSLRVIIPPLTSQMLNLTKNSSLAVAIGFPDFVSVANTTINQTGQAVEGVALIMAVYLIISLLTSAFMNWYNKRIALVER